MVPFENIVGKAQIIFFSVYRGRARLAILALAGVGALEQAVHDRQMSRKAKDRTALEEQDRLQICRQGRCSSARSRIFPRCPAAIARRQLSAAGISRRPCARPGHFRHALPRLSEGERRRAVAPAGRSRAQGNLRRRGARDGSWAGAQAWQFGIARRRAAAHDHSGRCLRGAGRRGVSSMAATRRRKN